MSQHTKPSDATSTPLTYGIVLFPGFQALDAFGPLDILNTLSMSHAVNLIIIAATLDPVSTKAAPSAINTAGSDCSQAVVPTHTFATAPQVDVLLVPGGVGTRASGIESTVAFIARAAAEADHIISVCTGSLLLADAGLLHGKRATTNKAAYRMVTEPRPQVDWVPMARWVRDGNVWTSSGISAGLDVMFAFVEEQYGESVATAVANRLEYTRTTDSTQDPFAKLYGLE